MRPSFKLRPWWLGLFAVTSMTGIATSSGAQQSGTNGYDGLVELFTQWRAFERPPLRQGAPDYTSATQARKHEQLRSYQAKLAAIDPSGWPVPQQVDYQLLRAEMNGLDFYLRVLKPWERDPAFYLSLWTAQSDTPAHEGPTHDRIVELWTYSFPLSSAAETKLATELKVIPPLLAQARINLTGNARDLWNAGIGTIRHQVEDLDALDKNTPKAGTDLKKSIRAARSATAEFVTWLEQQAPGKTGPSGVGKENYNWHLRNVLLVPMTWDEEVDLLKRELARAHASMRLEEERNRGLPPLKPIADAEEYQQRGNAAVAKYIAFLRDRKLFPMRDYMDPALRAQIGEFVPESQRNFFAIATHYEPLTLYTH